MIISLAAKKSHLTVYLAMLLNFLLLAGCARASDTDGLYLRTAFAFNQIESTTFYLHGDQIAWNPKGGVDPFDFAAAEKSEPANVGHFKINGDQMEITWGGGRAAQSLKIERQNGKMSALDGGLVSKVGSYSNDQKLDATFGGVMLAGGEGGITGGRTITFAKDGHFSTATLATAELNPNVAGGTGSVASDNSGTYTLSGNTLTLNFAGGKTEKHTVFPYNTSTDPANAKLDDEKLFYDTFQLARER
ncbi:MAG TPA: lipocalin family protein [Tepidisphaeraceae bacterium]|nr:lipocalin family protein [Tepidisphaeraceae bacterium]